jgi:mannose-6-phosphate isomerase-like protein (cupin superfamily)
MNDHLQPQHSMHAIKLSHVFPTLAEPWQPVTVAQCNGSDVMVAKGQGSYPWHKHDDTDDFFLVLQGTLVIEMRETSVTLGAGDMFVVPKGVEHRPVADSETFFVLMEPPHTAGSDTTLV